MAIFLVACSSSPTIEASSDRGTNPKLTTTTDSTSTTGVPITAASTSSSAGQFYPSPPLTAPAARPAKSTATVLAVATPPPSGQFVVAASEGSAAGTGPLHTYSVEVETTLEFDPAEFADHVDQTLRSPRSWIGDGSISLQRVGTDADFRIVLAAPDTTDQMCAPLRTNNYFSCRSGSDVVINANRWANATTNWKSSLDDYRTYVINHEVGHFLGFGHVGCPGAGEPAPVMMQQTKSIGPCAPNSWVHSEDNPLRHRTS